MKIVGIRKYNNMVWSSFIWIQDISCGHPQPDFVKQWKPLTWFRNGYRAKSGRIGRPGDDVFHPLRKPEQYDPDREYSHWFNL